MGFTRQGKEWSRQIGPVVEHVYLQVSPIAGTTANLWSYDEATNDLLKEALSWKPDVTIVLSAWRIGTLMDGHDRWWKNDPNGAVELAEAIKVHAPPFFEGWHSLEDQARLFGRAQPRWTRANTASRMYLALTLYRMGELEEACAALRDPPRTIPASWLVRPRACGNGSGVRAYDAGLMEWLASTAVGTSTADRRDDH